MDSHKDNIIALVSLTFLTFVIFRSFFWGLKGYLLNNSALRKIRKKETFKEWLLYTNFRQKFPKILLFLYYAGGIMHLGAIFAETICAILQLRGSAEIFDTIFVNMARIDSIFYLSLFFLFGKFGVRGYVYERWIPRKGRNKKTRK